MISFARQKFEQCRLEFIHGRLIDTGSGFLIVPRDHEISLGDRRICGIERDALIFARDVILYVVIADESRIFRKQVFAVRTFRPILFGRPAGKLVSRFRRFGDDGVVENVDGICTDIFLAVSEHDLHVFLKNFDERTTG